MKRQAGLASDYVPIACAEHERLEFAVLRRQRLRLEYRDEGGLTISRIVLPTDVATRDGAEWLSYREMEEARRDPAGPDRFRQAGRLTGSRKPGAKKNARSAEWPRGRRRERGRYQAGIRRRP
ncbi:MAG: hypothetical protein IPN00_12450 [Hydrogenophilales bacterium]|nr:hypothetical protein [Hydrogenophilales bacterium]